MIRFGPAAAPRWFDQDLTRLPRYLDLIAAAGGRAIEFVVLPGAGSLELGRVHVLERDAPAAIEMAQARGLIVNLHAPLPPSFRMSQWGKDERAYRSRFAPVIETLSRTARGQEVSPLLVMHAAANEPDVATGFLSQLLEDLSTTAATARISVELRARSGTEDDRFDRNLYTLAEFVSGLSEERIGICWDVAHDWENTGHISRLTPDLLALINHVHIHDSRLSGEVHAPLGVGSVPWRLAIQQLSNADWQGAITLEIRYRYATERGDPWTVLTHNLMQVRATLAGE